NEIVIVSAGSSAGTRDFTAPVISGIGRVLVHGIAMKPGKPVIIGKVGGKPVIGLPGYPLSALTVLREIVTPLLSRFGLALPGLETISATVTSTIPSDPGTDEFVLLAAGKVGDRYVASPLSRGAGVQMSAVRANAYLRVPAGVEGFEAGPGIPVHLMVPRLQVDSALLLTGSHDPCLDILADILQFSAIEAHSAHVGSMGGLIALKKDECHAAPMHLLAEDGRYNVPYLDRYLPDTPLVLLSVAGREQGIVSRDGIGIEDLPGHTFINRQRGSGTRILLDHELLKRSIDPTSIRGYEREATTHLGVALAVKTGEADAGMCVYSAAKSLGLKFVPVGVERYELAIRKAHWDDRRVQALAEAVRSDRLRLDLTRMGGYDLSITGGIRELH
ncbi:MAG: molybdopterin biosynthesis protein, partial [Methanoregulaceae archaeon]|nr:molybdopterin biosynthesis protein [Methanoregulaceae archaeon]